MSIELVRIDDRLIHGQVVTTWVKQYNIEQILIIDDLIAKDEIQKNVFSMVAPKDIIVRVFDVDKFIEIYQKTIIKRKTMILLTDPFAALKLLKGGVKFSSLNLGGMKYQEGKIQVTKAISLSNIDIENLKDIRICGVEVFIQQVPADRKLSFEKVLTNKEDWKCY